MKKTFEGKHGNSLHILCQFTEGFEIVAQSGGRGIPVTIESDGAMEISTHLIRCAHKMGATKAEIVKPLLKLLEELYPEGIGDTIEELEFEREELEGGEA